MNKPCAGKTAGGDDQDSNDNKGNGGPVVVLGGSPYNLDDKGPSGDNPPNHGNNPLILGGPKLPNHIDPTPEPTYLAVTGLAFAAVWALSRKRRVA